jgi:hypothetical protein
MAIARQIGATSPDGIPWHGKHAVDGAKEREATSSGVGNRKRKINKRKEKEKKGKIGRAHRCARR